MSNSDYLKRFIRAVRKKVPRNTRGTFSLRRLDVLFDLLKKIKGTKHTQNRACYGKNFQ